MRAQIMRDEQRDRMLIEIARALELLLADMMSRQNNAETFEAAENLADARRAFEQHYL